LAAVPPPGQQDILEVDHHALVNSVGISRCLVKRRGKWPAFGRWEPAAEIYGQSAGHDCAQPCGDYGKPETT